MSFVTIDVDSIGSVLDNNATKQKVKVERREQYGENLTIKINPYPKVMG